MIDLYQRSDILCRTEGGHPAPTTVITTVYNYARFLEEMLRSVAASTMDRLSLIVVDDCSTDGSVDVLMPWISEHSSRFCDCLVIRNRENYGLAYSRNLAVRHVRSDYFFVLDADNAVYPAALTKLHEACVKSGAAAAYCQLELFDEEEGLGQADFWEQKAFEYNNYIDAMAMVRTSACLAVGGYGYFEVPGYEDYDLWCKFVEQGYNAVFVPQILCRYRVHERSMLRRETAAGIGHLSAEMLFRHPWLKL